MAADLRSNDDNLRDLSDGQPLVVDAATGQATGIRLTRWLGAGGMSAVFMAERDPAVRCPLLSPITPRRLAVKIVKPSTEYELERLNLRSVDITRREIAALDLVRKMHPPTPHIIGLFGSGSVLVRSAGDDARELPWIALELVDAGAGGATLTDRVIKGQHGPIDPVRALRLARGIVEGVGIFHRFGVLHRDLKPDNVFVAGPVDDEVPKIADCGIARVEGVGGGTISAATLGYAGPEQVLSMQWPTQRNPLVGPWTDVHALAATLWFIFAGEQWCRSPTEWSSGVRRSLRTARHLHRGLLADGELLDALDQALRNGAAHALPDEARPPSGPGNQRPLPPGLFGHKERRHATVAAFAAELLPLLEQSAARWVERAGEERVPATQFRTTRVREIDGMGAPPALVQEVAPPANLPAGAMGPGDVVFLPGQWGFCRLGDKVFCFSQTEPSFFEVPVPAPRRRLVAESRWLCRGPGKGIALVGPAHVLLLPESDFELLPLPRRPRGGEVGPIQAVIGDGRVFGVVTAETDDSNGGPELWLSAGRGAWKGPVILPLGGDVHAVVSGPAGIVAVGSRNGKRARAFLLGHDRQNRVFTDVNDNPPLVVAAAGAEGESWAAGAGGVVRLDGGGASAEPFQGAGPPVAMGLDHDGIPWLLRERTVTRRVGGGTPMWWALTERHAAAPPFVAIGFTSEGVRVVDARGGGLLIQPQDTAETIPVAS
jgi:serine/threonine protein kinase